MERNLTKLEMITALRNCAAKGLGLEPASCDFCPYHIEAEVGTIGKCFDLLLDAAELLGQ